MPVYMKVDGIKGNVARAGNGGVWKTTNFLEGGTASRRGGARVAGGDLNSAASSDAVEILRISFPSAPFGFSFIDGFDANAANKTRMMFETQSNGGTFTLTFQGQTSGAANNIRRMNNLRQIALSGRTAPLIGIFVSSGGNSPALEVELENCLVRSYSIGAHSSAGGQPGESLSLNFTRIDFKN